MKRHLLPGFLWQIQQFAWILNFCDSATFPLSIYHWMLNAEEEFEALGFYFRRPRYVFPSQRREYLKVFKLHMQSCITIVTNSQGWNHTYAKCGVAYESQTGAEFRICRIFIRVRGERSRVAICVETFIRKNHCWTTKPLSVCVLRVKKSSSVKVNAVILNARNCKRLPESGLWGSGHAGRERGGSSLAFLGEQPPPQADRRLQESALLLGLGMQPGKK